MYCVQTIFLWRVGLWKRRWWSDWNHWPVGSV